MQITFRNNLRPKRYTFILKLQLNFVILRSLIFPFKTVRDCFKIIYHQLSLSQDLFCIVYDIPVDFVESVGNYFYYFCQFELVLLEFGECFFC